MKTFDEIFKLNEAIFKKDKIYYHVSKYDFTEFKLKKVNFNEKNSSEDNTAFGIFLTDNLYTISRFMDVLNNNLYLYKCKLKKDLNIFDFNNEEDKAAFFAIAYKDEISKQKFLKDYKKFACSCLVLGKKKEPLTDKIKKSIESCIEHAFKLRTSKSIQASSNYEFIENKAIVRIIKSLNYDGYCSSWVTKNLCVFDPQNIEIIRYEENSERLNKIINIQHGNVNMKNFIHDDGKTISRNVRSYKDYKDDIIWNEKEFEQILNDVGLKLRDYEFETTRADVLKNKIKKFLKACHNKLPNFMFPFTWAEIDEFDDAIIRYINKRKKRVQESLSFEDIYNQCLIKTGSSLS